MTVRECPQKDHDLVLLVIRQAKIADRHVEVVRDLRHGPAVYFFSRSLRTVSGRDVELEAGLVARRDVREIDRRAEISAIVFESQM